MAVESFNLLARSYWRRLVTKADKKSKVNAAVLQFMKSRELPDSAKSFVFSSHIENNNNVTLLLLN